MRTQINVKLTPDQMVLLGDLDSENPARALVILADLPVVLASIIDCASSPRTAMLELEPKSFLALDAEGERRNLKNSDLVRERAGLPIYGHRRAAPVKQSGQEHEAQAAPVKHTFPFPAPAGGLEWVWLPFGSLERLQLESPGETISNAFRARLELPPIAIFDRAGPRDRLAVAFHESEFTALRRACENDLPSLVRMMAGFEPEPVGEVRPKPARLHTDAEWASFLAGADLPPQPKQKPRTWSYLD